MGGQVLAGVSAVEEHGAPSWFEMHTQGSPTACSFDADVLGLDVTAITDSHALRYSVLRRPGQERGLAGICDDAEVRAEGEASHWAISWEVDGVDAAAAVVAELAAPSTGDRMTAPTAGLPSSPTPRGHRPCSAPGHRAAGRTDRDAGVPASGWQAAMSEPEAAEVDLEQARHIDALPIGSERRSFAGGFPTHCTWPRGHLFPTARCTAPRGPSATWTASSSGTERSMGSIAQWHLVSWRGTTRLAKQSAP